MNASQDIRLLTRRTIIDMARRRQRPGSGSSRAFLMQRTTVMQWPDLSPVLLPIPWAVVGAAATRLYMPERLTHDFDVAVAVQDANVVRHKLADAGYIKIGELSIGGSTWRTPDGQFVDMIEGNDLWWTAALTEAQVNRDPQGLPILPLHYLVLMKFNASRARDLGDITQMLGYANESALELVREVFRQYAPDDLEDLESLIMLGKLEVDH
jgi:hypothetical protein